MDVTLRQLRMICELAARGTIAAAAQSLGYTPSAVSQQLAVLERITGVPVLERIGRGVHLTDAGRELVVHAREVLAKVEEAQAAIEEVASIPRGEVRLAIFESFASSVMPDVVRSLRRSHPKLLLRSVELDPDEALNTLVMGSTDVALVVDYPHAPSSRPRGVERRFLRQERFRLVVPGDDDLPAVVELAALADRPFVMGSADTSWGRSVLQACREAGFDPDIHHEIDKTPATLQLVAAGAGVALIPDLALPVRPVGVRVIDLAEPLCRTIEVAYREASVRRPAIGVVLDTIVDVAQVPGSASLPIPVTADAAAAP
jgi:DNA-binding transcriptional LysR family regulator